MCPKFIIHPNGIVLRVFKQKQRPTDCFADKRITYRTIPSTEEILNADKREMLALSVMKKPLGTQVVTKKSLGTVSSNPNRIVPRVFNMSVISKKLLVIKKRLSVISHPNEFVLRVFIRQRSRIQKDQRRGG